MNVVTYDVKLIASDKAKQFLSELLKNENDGDVQNLKRQFIIAKKTLTVNPFEYEWFLVTNLNDFYHLIDIFNENNLEDEYSLNIYRTSKFEDEDEEPYDIESYGNL